MFISDPHIVKGSLDIQTMVTNDLDDHVVKINNMTCSCKADTSQSCKHIVPVLLYCNRKDLNSLEVLSSTDKQCLWRKRKRPVLEQFEAQNTKKICCVNQKRLPALSESTQESIRNRLIECNKNTALAKHRIYQSKITCNDILQTAIVTKDCKAKWRKERQFRIAGSRCYNLYTYSKDDWPNKAVKYFWTKEFTNKCVLHSNMYESVARNIYILNILIYMYKNVV